MVTKNQRNFEDLAESIEQIAEQFHGSSMAEMKINIENLIGDLSDLKSIQRSQDATISNQKTQIALLELEIRELKNNNTQAKNLATVDRTGHWQVVVSIIGAGAALIVGIISLIIQLIK